MSNLDWTASTTTMELSTTVPMARTSANNVRRLMVNPAIAMNANVPTRDTRMAIDGINVALKS